MRGTNTHPPPEAMPFAIRPLKVADITQSAEIEREAFPSLFPPTSFRRELGKRNASYLVAWRSSDVQGYSSPTPGTSKYRGDRGRGLVTALLGGARGMLNGSRSGLERSREFIAGFVGTWYMVDEAHIVSVGVRSTYRGRGIGELLLIGAIEQAMDRQAAAVTLEVRPSNWIAINLYHKYGFQERGLRKSYYSDNREDALIMTTDPIQHPDYRDPFLELQSEHGQRWGNAERVLV